MAIACLRRGREWLLALAMLLVLGAGLPALGQEEAATAGGAAKSFETYCYSCHNIGGGDKRGPDLMGVSERRTRAWLHEFIRTPKGMKNRGDAAAVEIFAKFAPEVMPDQLLPQGDIDQMLDLIAKLSQKKQMFVPKSGRLSRRPTPKDVPVGRALFTGRRALARAGPACIGCHNVGGIGYLGGGTLGPELTGAALSYREVELASILKAPAFPMMSKVYGDRELSDEEVVQLFAFLHAARVREDDRSRAGMRYVAGGTVGVVMVLGLSAVIWRRRLHGVRRGVVGMQP